MLSCSDLPMSVSDTAVVLSVASSVRRNSMKRLQGAVQASGYQVLHLVDPEDLGLLRFEETGELPDGLDFALLCNGVWREGRCYNTFPKSTFVTYGDAQRLPLCIGMSARVPRYTLSSMQALELAAAYARDLGDLPLGDGAILGPKTTITAGEHIDCAIPVGSDQPLTVITLHLMSSGDIHLRADTEVFLTTPPVEDEQP
jgi:hypothetical protein